MKLTEIPALGLGSDNPLPILVESKAGARDFKSPPGETEETTTGLPIFEEDDALMDLYNAWQWVEHIRSLSHRARKRAGCDLEEAERMLMLAMLWVLPFSSVEDVAGLGYLSRHRIERLLLAVFERGWAASAEMGYALGIRRRNFLLPDGVQKVISHWDVPEEWQTRDDTLKVLHGCLPVVEVVCDLLPRLWRTNAVRTPVVVGMGPKDAPHSMTIDENVKLCRLIWVRAQGRRVHGLAQYRNSEGFRLFIPFIWQGYVCSAADRVEHLSDFYSGFRTEPSGWYGEPAAPAGCVYLVPDRLSGFHVTMTVAKNIPKAVVTARGEVLEQLIPVSPIGYLHPPVEAPNVRPVGTSFAEWVKEPRRSEIYQEAPYGVFREVGIAPGISPVRLGEVIGRPRNQIRQIVEGFKGAGLFKETKLIAIEVETELLKKSNWKAELDVAEKKVRLPLRLPTEPGSRERTELELELDADHARVVAAGSVQMVARSRGGEIRNLNVSERIDQDHASLSFVFGRWPITVTFPFADDGPYRGTNLYLTHGGEVAFAEMDRDNVANLRGRYGEYDSARGRIRKASHDNQAYRLQASYLMRGGDRRLTQSDHRWFATSGLRMVVTFPENTQLAPENTQLTPKNTQLAPDLWLIIPIGNGLGLLVPLECEQTAETPSSVDNKLGPHFVARDRNAPFGLLMACTEKAVPNFRTRGKGLSMLVASMQDALEDRWLWPDQLPGTEEQRVGASHLTRRQWRGELVQRLDLRL